MSLFKAASTVSLLTLVSRITGLVRELLIASTFGASAMTDAFNVAFRIPNLFRRLFAEGAFSQAFVPVLAASKAQHGEEQTKLLIDRVATLLAWALLLTCVAGVAAAPVLVWAMASGLKQDPRGFEAAVFMTRWMFPYIGFMSLVALSSGVLNTWRRFAVPAATPVLLNLSMILAAWLGAPWFKTQGIEPVYALGGGVMLGGILQLAVQVPALWRLGLLPRIGLGWGSIKAAWADPATQNIARLMVPALLGVSVAQISLLINTQIASHLTPGSVSWLTYADRLMEFPTAMLGVAIGVVLMPQLSAAKAAGDSAKYSAMLDWGLRLVVLLAVPCGVALLTFAQPLVATLYHYGAFTDRDVQQTTTALMGYGAGLLGLVAIKVLAPGFYASQDIKTPVRIAIVVLVVTQLLNLAFVPFLQHAGLALAIGIGALINALWLLIGLKRRGSYTPAPGWGVFALQVVAASALLAVFLLWAAGAVNWIALKGHSLERIGLLALVLLASAALYFVALWVSGLKVRKLLKH
ncbi:MULTISPECIES: murein biosynthesis integral membrane protein MurJ [unclassified Polaromonas]|uniref:murein biosynthesis integral membrane protein MurJ n=1 Tax=unclassified Polaromonas TaxID=2638319 RepID=UPI000F093FD9|nr:MULTISPECIES: murein biosynthesis integral membrane protein MurJ [unclassified Polaromonas]AYQ28788.1 murein biosynthesis integral membrane protein MurJ [Polaromonas sp. SP1]QGJ20097.1 murein biosynthesis integral membrane protein MurJ [Polaromonas sp. Pch-P]